MEKDTNNEQINNESKELVAEEGSGLIIEKVTNNNSQNGDVYNITVPIPREMLYNITPAVIVRGKQISFVQEKEIECTKKVNFLLHQIEEGIEYISSKSYKKHSLVITADDIIKALETTTPDEIKKIMAILYMALSRAGYNMRTLLDSDGIIIEW